MAFKNDGGVVFGSQVVTIPGRDDSNQDYVLEGLTLTDPSNYPTHVAGEVKEWNPKEWMDPKDARRMSRSSQFAVAAARQA